MNSFEEVMMNRDKLSREESMQKRREARAELYRILEEGGDYDDVEEMMMMYDYGLEMDYIMDLM